MNVPLVEGNHDESIVTKSIKNFELTRHFRAQFKFISTEKVKLIISVLAKQCIDSYKFDKLRWVVQRVFILRKPIVVKVCAFLSNRSNDIVNKIIDQVLQVRFSGCLSFLVGEQRCLILLKFGLCIAQLRNHLIVPLFDSFEHTRILIKFIRPDLLFSLLNLFVFEFLKL